MIHNEINDMALKLNNLPFWDQEEALDTEYEDSRVFHEHQEFILYIFNAECEEEISLQDYEEITLRSANIVIVSTNYAPEIDTYHTHTSTPPKSRVSVPVSLHIPVKTTASS